MNHSIECTVEHLATIVSGLVKEGIVFKAVEHGEGYKIIMNGGY
jgi:hypothetical protein